MMSIKVNGLTVAYHRKPVLSDVTFELPKGVIIGILGPNGAGKTTLMKAILGLVQRSTGEVSVLGEPYSPKYNKVGYVPQRGTVDWDFPTDALDVVRMGRYRHTGWFRLPSRKDTVIALDCLKQVGMEEFAGRQISQLSGGQQQRVFLARALAQDTEVYFMDEPFAGVDAATEKSIIALLTELKDQGKTVLVVHHDLQTVTDYFDWTLLLNRRVIGCGPTEQVFTMENLRSTYGGKLAFLDKIGSR
ncbi:metal ABC transporter ATP-binding protein [Rossellomorea marisflavi]|uniref:Manganese ABC transporter ATP-binding protein n=1 Tax=Rossellomorea marisflavi TaxID=189381 RepID=A0A161SZT9_9BACI|nr:metal ABC transporter ATP-binding protein [Rossellomorea marisflavi]KZE45543.1 manganese ABC transporter ATP-binding protein [Rossellomorea marisflavi]QHA36668.1 ATP-binding cassette domain-containing protein [Rossellomorea marisflavi]